MNEKIETLVEQMIEVKSAWQKAGVEMNDVQNAIGDLMGPGTFVIGRHVLTVRETTKHDRHSYPKSKLRWLVYIRSWRTERSSEYA